MSKCNTALVLDFSVYGQHKARPFALPVSLAVGAGCAHGSRHCWVCALLSRGYEAAMGWARGLQVEPLDLLDADDPDQTLVQRLLLEV